MALEAVVFPQDLPFPHNGKDISNNYNFIAVAEEDTGVLNGMHANWDHSSSSWSSSIFPETEDLLAPVSLSPKTSIKEHLHHRPVSSTELTGKQRKRRRVRSFKNKEEVENQRMTHIAVERNRRKQMNDYLASLRSLMPPSYVQRGDQASIIGGAINFVKQLEQLQQSLEAQKLIKQRCNNGDFDGSTPFADHFTFPQYSSASSCNTDGTSNGTATSSGISNETIAERRSASADIEVTMVEGHANVKILAKRRPKQLVKLIVGLHNLCLSTLHLNVTAVEHFVLYCFSLKVEEECQCGTVDDIATAVHHLVAEIQEQAELV
ncbi:Upstream transcription factor 2/L-myc-2 protein [Dioscorea alata]|uniref:Upstream transcription factor 2/L-myc-2 protein n=1 Tax=Dioscorea alata TaxID=55571 RepID=A0ACB7U5F3_DIOAL|nr:Upstream transcription factor 2/L-myc-2 protein [Dioscorea alata]